MALLTFAGFDFADPSDSTEWIITGSLGRSSTARTGTRSGDVGVGTLGKSVSNLATVIVGCAHYIAGTNVNYLTLLDGSTEQISCVIEADRSITVRRGSASGTILGQSAVSLFPPSAWTYLELKANIHSSTGSVVLKLNGVTKISVSGINTQNTANAYVTRVRFQNGLIDDLYICDTTGAANNDFLGDVRVETLYPNGAGTYTEWTPSTGSNWQNVDDATTHDGDSTYNSTATAGNRDLYTLTNLATVTGTVQGVRGHMKARKDDSNVRELALFSRSSTTETTGATEALGVSYVQYDGAVQETDPATSAAWTIAGVNALQFGQKVIT